MHVVPDRSSKTQKRLTRLTSVVLNKQVTTALGLKANGTLLCCGSFKKTCHSNDKPRPRSQRHTNSECAHYITWTVGRDGGRTPRKSFSATDDNRSAVGPESRTAGRKEARVSGRDVRVGRRRLI